MSRIEISLKEYNFLKNKIKELESLSVENSKEIEQHKEKMNTIKDLATNLEEESLYNRVFNWKNIIKPLKELWNK